MSEARIAELAERYADGAASPAEMSELAEALRAAPDLARAIREQIALHLLLDSHLAPDSPERRAERYAVILDSVSGNRRQRVAEEVGRRLNLDLTSPRSGASDGAGAAAPRDGVRAQTERGGTSRRVPVSTARPRHARRRVRLYGAPAALAASVLLALGVIYLVTRGARAGRPGAAPPNAPRGETAMRTRESFERLKAERQRIQESLAALDQERRQLAESAEPANPPQPETPGTDLSRQLALARVDADRKALEDEMARTVEAMRQARQQMEAFAVAEKPGPDAPPSEVPPRPEETAFPRQTTAPHATAAAVARLERAEGEVFVQAAPQERERAVAGRAILPGMGLATGGASSRAVVAFPDGTCLEVGADTTIARLDDGREGKRAALDRGALTTEVARQPEGLPMVFATPHAEAVVLGTRLILTVTPDKTRLEVKSGRVRCVRLADRSAREVTAGHWVEVPRQGAVAAGAAPQAHWPVRLIATDDKGEGGAPIPDVEPLADGAVIDLSRFPGRHISLMIDPPKDFRGSIRIELDGASTLQGLPPYELTRLLIHGTKGPRNPPRLPNGPHVLVVTPITDPRDPGYRQWKPFLFRFSVR